MALSFPSNPSINQTYTYNNKVWVYNGARWITSSVSLAPSAPVTVSETEPGTTVDGALWVEPNTSSLSVHLSNTWVTLGGGGGTSLPTQTGQTGKYLTTDGTDPSWAEVDSLPSQTSNSGKYLTTNGSVASWAEVDSLPSQTSNSGKYLTTNGSVASWSTIDTSPADGSITPVKLALGTTYLPMAIGTTAERPSTPAAGYIRINTTTNYFEVYYNGQWINLQYIGAMTITYTGTPTVTTSGGYTTLKFNSSGSITVTNMQAGSTFEYLMVAGGGGGGNTMGGGGGAGGLLYNSGFSPATNNPYSFTIGAGGAGATNRGVVAGSGTNTTGFSLTCIGGGGGAGWDSANSAGGGSGAGGVNARTPGAGTTGQGFQGGTAGGSVAGGGGGGATAAGTNGASGPGGAGYNMTSIGMTFGGGGGGGWGSGYGTSQGGAGGAGGGGQGGQAVPGTDATINTGSGGGGGGYGPGDYNGGSGASGTVIIRYRSA